MPICKKGGCWLGDSGQHAGVGCGCGCHKTEDAMGKRFDYVRYDERATNAQEAFKDLFTKAENLANETLDEGRAKSLFLTYLEIAYMWSGKAIRDDQITRGSQPEHVPERGAE